MAYEATIEGWSQAMDLRDKETEGHTRRVTELSIRLGKMMGLDDEEIIHLRRGALLHDIGKIGVPDHILLKPDKLTDEEMQIMQKHPQIALDMLRSIAYLRRSLDIPHYHHEKWDGSGYPQGLKGEPNSPGRPDICHRRRVGCVDQRPSLPQGLDQAGHAAIHPRAERKTFRPKSGGGVPERAGK